MFARLLVAAVMLFAGVARADGIDAHLLAGARAFRAQQYETALAEFRQVERAGGTSDLALYLGPTLYKLGRVDEARLVLGRVHRAGGADAIAEYYLGLCWYRLGLVRLARTIFATVDAREAGPKLAEGAAHFLSDIDARPTAPTSIAPLVAAAEALEANSPLAALDDAEEAFLRAAPGTPERLRAAAVISRLAAPGDQVARRAVVEQAHPAP